jgi:hypothetical protein
MSKKPKLNAEFELDADGEPKREEWAYPHYWIRLSLENVPDDVTSVTYKLHDTFDEPKRKVLRGVSDFEEYIASYGDFEILATLHGDEVQYVTSSLFDALRRHYAGTTPNEAIRKALNHIQSR